MLKKALTKLWRMYEHEKGGRITDNVGYVEEKSLGPGPGSSLGLVLPNVGVGAWGVILVHARRKRCGRAVRVVGDIKLPHCGEMLVSSTSFGRPSGKAVSCLVLLPLVGSATRFLAPSMFSQEAGLGSVGNPQPTLSGEIGADAKGRRAFLPAKVGSGVPQAPGHLGFRLLLRGRCRAGVLTLLQSGGDG